VRPRTPSSAASDGGKRAHLTRGDKLAADGFRRDVIHVAALPRPEQGGRSASIVVSWVVRIAGERLYLWLR
jgi:hypothetical protein